MTEKPASEITTTGLRVPRKLMLGGMYDKVIEQLARTDLLDLIGEENIFPVEKQYGAALKKAVVVAQQWIDAGSSKGSSAS